MDFIPHIKFPTFRGVITRRTTPQLKGSGGILDTALQMYKKVDSKVKWKSQENKFVFSSGAEVYLRHFEYLKDKDNYQGLQANEILVDEAQQYEEEQIVYLMSRLRNPSCPQVKPRIKMTCNPLKSSFLCKWISWWLDEEGYPRKDRDGVVRYFIRKDNTMIWADTKEELIEKYSTPLFTPTPMSFCFISALITDNPALLEAQPEYLGWLEGLGRVEQARLDGVVGILMKREVDIGRKSGLML